MAVITMKKVSAPFDQIEEIIKAVERAGYHLSSVELVSDCNVMLHVSKDVW